MLADDPVRAMHRAGAGAGAGGCCVGVGVFLSCVRVCVCVRVWGGVVWWTTTIPLRNT